MFGNKIFLIKKVGFIFILFVLISQIHSATLSGIQKGTTTLSAGSNSVAQAITSLTLSQSFLVFNIRIDDADPGDYMVGGYISATNQLIFTRQNAGGSPVAIIEWQVFSFSSGVSVQRGISTGVSAAGINIPITAVNLSQAFATVNVHKDGGQFGVDDGVTADLTSTTNLFLDREAGGADPQFVYWQVIEWTGSSVQKITATINNGVDSVAVTLGIAVNKSKTMIIGTHRQSGDLNDDDLASTELLNTSTAIFTRVGTANILYFLCYVVEFTDNTDVVHGSIRMTSTQNSISTAICSVTAAQSGIIPPSNYFRAGSNCRVADDNMGFGWSTITLTSGTLVTAARANTGSAARFPFQVLEFTASTPTSCGVTEPGNSTPRTIGLCSAVLPIELINFDAKFCSDVVCINWITASEKNNSEFAIERSDDAINFTKINQMPSQALDGNSSKYLYYETMDKNPAKGINYYRLKQIDFDKSYAYSPIVYVDYNLLLEDAITVFPNPSNGEFNINMGNYVFIEPLNLILLNCLGEIVYQDVIFLQKESNSFQLKFSQILSKGFYILTLTGANDSKSSKVIIQ